MTVWLHKTPNTKTIKEQTPSYRQAPATNKQSNKQYFISQRSTYVFQIRQIKNTSTTTSVVDTFLYLIRQANKKNVAYTDKSTIFDQMILTKKLTWVISGSPHSVRSFEYNPSSILEPTLDYQRYQQTGSHEKMTSRGIY